ncbi:MAG: HAD family phosphatase [Erysipelotrichaceae bacterium]|nr:HAD family phosphatase [Erysipelotrichaceae bacterium]MBQ1776372.1 HAD family phosphatase [Erysipelotrichaceae bacterium]MBQ2078880.1 HAD family phosphatase [Erysipelotrichaceae bacterium]MBQ2232025.1 HAD family phosphatase [Erysipelotrichaceae bacterium]MBQ5553179.1 HAD family phosphatase [Erysipelotrichaceae bacterium]
MEKEKLKAIVFDFDGTIADTEGFYADNFFEVMAGYGIHCDAEDRVKTLGYGPDEKVAMMKKKYQVKLDSPAIAAAFRKMNADRFPEDGSHLIFNDVEDALDYCKKQGYALYICSNTDSTKVKKITRQMGIIQYFDDIVGKDISGARKPSSDPYRFMLKQYGYQKEEMAAIEDSRTGVASARGAGIPVIGLCRMEGLDLGETDVLIRSLAEIKNII